MRGGGGGCKCTRSHVLSRLRGRGGIRSLFGPSEDERLGAAHVACSVQTHAHLHKRRPEIGVYTREALTQSQTHKHI